MKTFLIYALVCHAIVSSAQAQAQPNAAPPGSAAPPAPAGPAVCPSIPVVIARARVGAENGEHSSQSTLGTYYSEGVIMKQDKVEAYAWFSLAGAKNREELEKSMTPQQIADGQKRAKQLQAQIEVRCKNAK